MDDLDAIINELAKELSHKHPIWQSLIKTLITQNKEEIKTWLKKNKTRLIPILKKL